MENDKKEMTIKEKIDALQLVPLFPDTNYFVGKDKTANEYAITNDSIIIRYNREEANLTMTAVMLRSPFTNKKYGRVFMVVNTNENTKIYENFSTDAEQEYLDNLPELVNKFNEYYEATAKVFNQELIKTIKDELEKEKEKQKEKEEQEKQEQEEKGEQEESEEQSEEEQKGEGEQGESEKGEGEQGESEKGEGEQGEMTSEEIQKMIDDLSKDEKGESQEGQSDNKGNEIDLEDFLDQVEKGNADNDFGMQYNNKDLKDKIDYEKQGQEEPKEQPKGQPQEQKYTLTNVLGSVKEMFSIGDQEMKRRFPNPTSVSDFVDSLSKAKIEELSNKVGLPTELSNLEKTKQIKTNLIIEIQNI